MYRLVVTRSTRAVSINLTKVLRVRALKQLHQPSAPALATSLINSQDDLFIPARNLECKLFRRDFFGEILGNKNL